MRKDGENQEKCWKERALSQSEPVAPRESGVSPTEILGEIQLLLM